MYVISRIIEMSSKLRDLSDPPYKQMHLDIDVGNKSDRAEWGHLRYQTVFRPDQAYELVVEWLTASGSIVAELVSVERCFFLVKVNFYKFCSFQASLVVF